MVRTFHSFGAWFLRRNAGRAGLDPGFLIYDEDDSISLLKGVLGANEDKGYLRRTSEEIGRVKDVGIAADAADEEIARAGCAPAIYRAYEERLRATGNVDFGDLILLPIRILRAEAEVRDRTRQRFRVILVDEYQDSNIAQFELLRELCGPQTYLCVVGDDDQSIYRFRGAEVGNILSFPKVFPGTEIVRLERNYRSTQAILDAASAVVSRNSGRLGKKLWTEKPAGEPVRVACLMDQEEEALFCGRLAADGYNGSTAILYRMNAQSRPFEEHFFHARIPYRVVGTVRFYSREEVKDAVAYLSFLANPRDEVAFRRIVNKPARGIGSASVEKIVARWREMAGEGAIPAESGGPSAAGRMSTLLDACARSPEGLSSRVRSSLSDFRGLFERLRARVEDAPLAELARELISATGLYDLYKTRDSADGTVKAANLEELVSAMSPYGAGAEALSRFLENSALASALEEPESGTGRDRSVVTLITLHNTKGLEFDRVIITGLEEGIFPHASSSEDAEDLEEERRIFYVGITRAREKLVLTWCRRRRIFGRWSEMEPSRFLEETAVNEVEGETRRGTGPAEAEDGFPVGGGVYHDEYGPGVVEKKWYTGNSLVVQVRFHSGRVARFLPKYARLERIHIGE
jgi:DNA helicase-2/ATP-dependent DNA helicase PcrA